MLDVDARGFPERRRAQDPAELAGIRRAQAPPRRGMAAGAALPAPRRHRRRPAGGRRRRADGRGRARAIRDACAAAGAPGDAGPDGRLDAGRAAGHDPGSGPLPADLPIDIDLWPQDEADRLLGRHDAHVRGRRRPAARGGAAPSVVREALEAARPAGGPGVTGSRALRRRRRRRRGRGLPDAAHPPAGRDRSTQGFYFRSATASGSRCTRRRCSAWPAREPLGGRRDRDGAGHRGPAGSAGCATRICC